MPLDPHISILGNPVWVDKKGLTIAQRQKRTPRPKQNHLEESSLVRDVVFKTRPQALTWGHRLCSCETCSWRPDAHRSLCVCACVCVCATLTWESWFPLWLEGDHDHSASFPHVPVWHLLRFWIVCKQS